MGLDESLPNPQRGIFHIQNAAFWQFFDLEYAFTSPHRESTKTSRIYRLKNGPYGIYNRDASNNHFERLITHDNYETGKTHPLTNSP
jgi:hypothetical protein